jgi:hypothetical protein
VSSANFKTEKNYISLFFKVFVFTVSFLTHVKVHAEDWSVDLSRRQTDFKRIENQRMPSSNVQVLSESVDTKKQDSELLQALKSAVNPVTPSQDIVIIQNEKGFVPDQLNLKKGEVYQIHIVNLNPKEKNVSFLMDSFSQSHNTVFGVTKTFKIQPQVEGVFSYQSPETGLAAKWSLCQRRCVNLQVKNKYLNFFERILMSSENSNFKEVIARALGPVQEFLNDPGVSEVLINGHDQIFVERNGKLELTKAKFPDEDNLQAAINTIAQSVGRRINKDEPRLDARLPIIEGSPPVDLELRLYCHRFLVKVQLSVFENLHPVK